MRTCMTMPRNVQPLVAFVRTMAKNAKTTERKISAKKSKRLVAKMKMMLRNVPRVVTNVMMMEEMINAKTKLMLINVPRVAANVMTMTTMMAKNAKTT